MLTDEQRAVLGRMIAAALVEIRFVAGAGATARAADLADVFHNVPAEMFGSTWWHPMDLREDCRGYQKRHRDDAVCCPEDFVAMFDAAFGEQFATQILVKRGLESRPSVRTGTWRRADGAVGLLLRIVSVPARAADADWLASPGDAGNPSVWYYLLYGRADGSQWTAARTRFATLREAMEHAEQEDGPTACWDAAGPPT